MAVSIIWSHYIWWAAIASILNQTTFSAKERKERERETSDHWNQIRIYIKVQCGSSVCIWNQQMARKKKYSTPNLIFKIFSIRLVSHTREHHKKKTVNTVNQRSHISTYRTIGVYLMNTSTDRYIYNVNIFCNTVNCMQCKKLQLEYNWKLKIILILTKKKKIVSFEKNKIK